MAQGLSRADRRRGTKGDAYRDGRVDGMRILTDNLRKAFSHPLWMNATAEAANC